jgi:hypothetical protein
MKADLFNEKTISKFILKIEPNSKQKSASKKWIELLEKDELQEEVSNYPRFTEIILKEILGYDTLNFKHEEKNMEFPFRDKSGNFLVCFEAKGTKTSDLWALQGRSIKIRETPVNQINDYLYKNKIPFGVLTNYREFVLFKREEGYTKFHKLDFFDIKNNPEKLKEFIAIFSRESFEGKETERLYNQSITEERNFTKEFYKLYHETRLMILKEFKESGIENEICLHYSQLFLNRLMFIFFAEDSDLLEKRYFENKILEVLDKSGGIDGYTNYVFGKINGIFRELDKEIPKQIKGFNGELFKEEIDGRLSFKDYRNPNFFKDVFQNYKLDKSLELNENDRQIFNKHKNKLNKIIENILLMASFDFETEVNVNILGHIFEQSISDIENLKEETSSKRKQEGVFYTPEYITEYICRNTIVPYLSKSGTNDINLLIEEYSENMGELEKKFKDIKILDPACGSGAFLIKSTEILFEIFEKVQWVKENYGEYQANRGLKRKSNFKGQSTLKKWDERGEIKNIIENNIFGVDINEESVEITKLSLFLKIATKNKKLIDLSKNIKQGNSLIDDEEIAGKLAFNWDKEFPFKFDVVIGNPPYGAKMNEEEVKFVKKNYSVGNSETAQLMMEKAYSLLKENGYHGFIIPKAFTFVSTWDKIRNKFLDELNTLIDCKKVWKEVKLEQIVYTLQKGNKLSKYNSGIRDNQSIKIIANVDKSLIPKFDGVLLNSLTNQEIKIGSKIKDIRTNLGKIGINKWGDVFYKQMNQDKKGFKVLGGNEIQRYYKRGVKGYIEEKYVKTDQSLIKPNSILLQRIISHIENPIDHLKISGTIFDESDYRIVNTVHQLNLDKDVSNKYVLAIMNSNFMNWFVYRFVFAKAIRSFQFSGDVAKKIPIPKISLKEQEPFIEKVDLMLKLNKDFYEKRDKILRLLKQEYNLSKITQKLERFHELDFDGFIKQLGVNNLSMSKKSELLDFFDKNKKEISEIDSKIEKTDGEINKMVYDLYGITDPKEREIIRNS